VAAFAAGAAIGTLGGLIGLIGLGGAEFRLPLLIGLFGFAALQAVIMNKAMSLVVVLTALPARLGAVPVGDLTPHWTAVLIAAALAANHLGTLPSADSVQLVSVRNSRTARRAAAASGPIQNRWVGECNWTSRASGIVAAKSSA